MVTKYRYQSRIISIVNILNACLRLLLSVSSDRCKLAIDALFYRLGNILTDRNYYNLKGMFNDYTFLSFLCRLPRLEERLSKLAQRL
jgi:hypothetical protein